MPAIGDIRASGVTLDRFCGGGITATSLAAAQIKAGHEDLVIAGGTEMMSHIMALAQQEMASWPPARVGLGTGNKRLQQRHPQSNQGLCADAIAALEGIDRVTLDAWAGSESQQRAARAIGETGRFDRSIVPVVDDEGKTVLAKDEYPRADTTAEGLAALKPSFAAIADMPADESGTTFRQLINQRYPDLKIAPLHHAGNSSGVVTDDGAARSPAAGLGGLRAQQTRAEAACPHRRRDQYRR